MVGVVIREILLRLLAEQIATPLKNQVWQWGGNRSEVWQFDRWNVRKNSNLKQS